MKRWLAAVLLGCAFLVAGCNTTTRGTQNGVEVRGSIPILHIPMGGDEGTSR